MQTNFSTTVKYAILSFAAACTFAIQSTQAGVFTTANGVISSYTANNQTTYYFYETSFIAAESQLELRTQEWWGTASASTPIILEIQDTYASGISGETSDSSFPNYYIFAFNASGTNVNVQIFVAAGTTSNAILSNLNNAKTSENISGRLLYATTVAPASSSVPEPSTAIAMGLLGVVGFAGNRRRRRQVSAA